ncbi:MAG: hypothetical protein IK062_05750 [Selenomonadaceae bacterium]|nr:hypothetical protein [Selenomonadaceae bacterium]
MKKIMTEIIEFNENFSAEEKIKLFKNTLTNEIKNFSKVGTKNYVRPLKNFVSDIKNLR